LGILPREADIHHHTWTTYQDALAAGEFRAVVRQDVRISAAIAPLLTAESFPKVVGRAQVLLCAARKAA
jgi:hypothetical protein